MIQKGHLFHALQVFILLSKFWSASNILSLVLSMSWAISVSLMWILLLLSLPLGIFLTIPFLIYVNKFILISLPSSVSRVSQTAAVVAFLSLAVSCMTPFRFDFTFSFSFIIFRFFVVLVSLLAGFLFQLSMFVQCQVDLSPGDKEAKQLTALLFGHQVNNRCAATPCQQTLQEAMWLLTRHHARLSFTLWFVD